MVSWREDGPSTPMEIDADCINLLLSGLSLPPLLSPPARDSRASYQLHDPSFRRTKNNADILSASSFSNFAPRFREIYNPVRGSRHVQPASFVPTALYRALPSVRLEISALCRLVNVETRFARFPVRRISRISSFSLFLSLSLFLSFISTRK